MSPASRPARLAIALAAALVVSYILLWSHVGTTAVGRSDFTSTYVGGTLFRDGHRADLYSEALQASLHSALIAPDREGNLPFVDAPAAALLVAPVTLLRLDTAYRLWGLIQLALLVAAVVVAALSAPWPRSVRPAWKAAAAAVGLAGVGTLALLLQAQWTAVSALGLALAYQQWKRGRLGSGAALLVVSAGLAKPHLAIGLLAFMLGWRSRRLLFGALSAAVAMTVCSVLLVTPAGIAGFVGSLASSTTRWDLDSFVSFIGLPGVIFGNSALAQGLGIAGSVLACGVAFWLGSLVRRHTRLLEPALAGAALLSLLAAPHALLHDLALLAPVCTWMVAFALQTLPGENAPHRNRSRPLQATLAGWVFISAAALASIASGEVAAAQSGALVPGATVTPVLLACATLIAVMSGRWARGMRNVTVLPRPGALSTPRLPPWSSKIRA